MKYSARPQKWFWIVSIIFLLWNLMGLGAWLSEIGAPEMITSQMNEEQLSMYNSRPAWYIYVYGIAVFTGLFACIFLLFKKKQAVMAAAISLICVIATTIFNMTNGAWDVITTVDSFFFISVPLLGILLLLFARSASHRNWIR